MAEKAEIKKATKEIAKYSKKQILSSKKFSLIEKDVLKALIEDDKQYSIDEVVKLLKDFLEKGVK